MSYSGVVEMVRSISGDAFADELQQQIDSRRVVHLLMVQRAVAGLSDPELATRMGSTRRRVRSIENGTDADLKYEDLRDYINALERGNFG